MKRLALLLAVLAATGCVTTGDLPSAAEASPEDAALANLRLGSEYLQRGERERALDKLNRAIEQDPHLAPAHAYLGMVYGDLGRNDEASRHFRTALRLDDEDATVRNMYAVHLCRNDKIREAEENFLAAATVPSYTTPEIAYTNAGVCVLKLPDNELAENYFRTALQHNPRYAKALWQMTKLTNNVDRAFQSRAFLQRLSEVMQLSPQALWVGVQVEQTLGDERAADEYARMLMRDYPESVEARLLAESR